MIKKFNEYINEDYFSKLASRKDNSTVRIENEITEEFVMSFVCKGYEDRVKSISIRKENCKTIVDIDGDFVLSKETRKIPFQFGEIKGDFDCTSCILESLNGCPRRVYGNFTCMGCDGLNSLKGAPEIVAGHVSCIYCGGLRNLEGVSKTIGAYFDCSHCGNLVSLKGAENMEVRSFRCNGCSKLKSLEFIPNTLRNVSCSNCGILFTKDYVRSFCNVIESILV